MQKKLVRCYRSRVLGVLDRFEEIVFTLPDFGYYNRLYSCLQCGAIFTASEEHENYFGTSVADQTKYSDCPECGVALSTSLQPYPQAFRVSDGSTGHFTPRTEYPDDSESIIKEVWNLYS